MSFNHTESHCPDEEACSRQEYAFSHEKSVGMDDRISELTVQFRSHMLREVSDVLTYDLQSMVGEVGGTMGMYLGASFLSIVEVLMIKVFECARGKN